MLSRLFVAIVAVAALGLGAVAGYSRHASANIPAPYTAEDADVNVDGVVNPGDQAIVASKVGKLVTTTTRQVAEQNLDGNGNIKVHEQGTVNVNVVAQGAHGRAIPITQDHVGSLATVFVPTGDCARLDVYLAASGLTAVNLYPSIDGNTAFNGMAFKVWDGSQWFGNLTLTGASAAAPTNFGVDGPTGSLPSASAAPFVGVEIPPGVSGSASVWLYCRFAS